MGVGGRQPEDAVDEYESMEPGLTSQDVRDERKARALDEFWALMAEELATQLIRGWDPRPAFHPADRAAS
jgi:hypothetical protein